MALDYGDVRIGVAISDALGIAAHPLTTISRKNPIDHKESIVQICKIAYEYSISTIILGYPVHMNNTKGENCKKADIFMSKLKDAMPDKEIILIDERLTTSIAKNALSESKFNSKNYSKIIDSVAASLILQSYLELRRTKTDDKKRSKGENMEDNQNFENMDDNGFNEEELNLITMTDEDGNEMEYIIIDEFLHNNINYILAIDYADFDEEESNAAIFKQINSDDNDFFYEELNEKEYEEIISIIKERMPDFDIEY